MTARRTDRDRLQARILDFIQTVDVQADALPASAEAQFEELALAVFRYQFDTNPAYQNLCRRRGITPETLARWQDIPAVATASFKHVDLFCGDPAEAVAVFHTSGTTQSRPGRHFFRTLELYRAAAMRWFRVCCLPDVERLPVLILGPSAEQFPHSSLGQMFSWIRETFGRTDSLVAFTPDGIAYEDAIPWLLERIARREPVLILGTSLALWSWCENEVIRRESLTLPEGSRIIDTGGYKGKKQTLSREAYLHMLSGTFGLASEWIFNEYGMTELSSQMYESRFTAGRFGRGVKVAPPWLRIMSCDPQTLAVLPEGRSGVLRFFDLANLDSVAMLQTEDFGAVRGRTVRLEGRLIGAEPRGCSLLAEEILQS